MKKTKIYFFTIAVLFLGIFCVEINKVQAVTEAECKNQLDACVKKAGTSKSKQTTLCNTQYEKCNASVAEISSGQIISVPDAMIFEINGERVNIPAGSKINTSTGVATLPSGLTVAGISKTDINSLVSDTNGIYNSSNTSGTGLANNQSSDGASTAGCETGFDKIGGVCFPTDTGLSEASITSILGNLFSWVMGLFTMLAIIAFVISGIQYLTAAGDDDRMENGKKNLTFSIIGVLVGLSGFVIVQAIASALSGSTNFF